MLSNALLPGSFLDTKLSNTVEEKINHLLLKYKNTYEDAIFVHPYQYQSTGGKIICTLLMRSELDNSSLALATESKNSCTLRFFRYAVVKYRRAPVLSTISFLTLLRQSILS